MSREIDAVNEERGLDRSPTPARPAEDLPLATEQLRDLWAQFERNQERVARLARDLTNEQLAWRPALGKWSVLECIDHLATTALACVPYWDRAIAAGARRAGPRSPKPIVPGFFGRQFVRSLGPTNDKKYQASKIFVPGTSLKPDAVMNHFSESHRAIFRVMQSADNLNLGKITARSAATGILRFDLATWFIATIAHEQRHLNQMTRVVEHPQFPTSSSR